MKIIKNNGALLLLAVTEMLRIHRKIQNFISVCDAIISLDFMQQFRH